MNKKIKCYSLLLIAVLVVTSLNGRVGVKGGALPMDSDEHLELGAELEGITTTTVDSASGNTFTSSQYLSFDVLVEPKNGKDNQYLISHTPQKPVQATQVFIQKAKLQIPAGNLLSNSTFWLLAFVMIVISALYVWIAVLAFKIMRSVIRGEIFVCQVARQLETVGKLLSCIFLVDSVFSYLGYLYVSHYMALAQYNIVFENRGNVMFLVMGLVLIIISQIILMGKELKEEQELTI